MKSLSNLLNDGSSADPRLSVFLNLDTLRHLRGDSIWLQSRDMPEFDRLRHDGFEGVQITGNPVHLTGRSLPHCGLDRINTPDEAAAVVARHAAAGDLCVTVHAGWGMENDRESLLLVESILSQAESYNLPVFLETHRATITQDLWRTVQIARHFPEIRFNGDFSHYYCGQELAYGDWSDKLSFMEPILERIGFLHGRIASPGCMQVPIDIELKERRLQSHGDSNYLDHFRELWTRAMAGFLRSAVPGDVLIFAPELLSGANYYARMFPDSSGQLVEESDRYQQALLLKNLAKACFVEAKKLWNTDNHQSLGPLEGA